MFIRNDLFVKINSFVSKTANVEFLMLQEKLGICPNDENHNKKSFDKLLDEFLD